MIQKKMMLNISRLDSNEEELYKETTKHLSLCGRLITDRVEKKGKLLYVIGERHKTRDPIDYVHNEIVPLIKEDPKTWIILKEGIDSYLEFTDEEIYTSVPDLFYFKKLANALGIVGFEAIGDILGQNTRAFITTNSDISEEQIDQWFTIGALQRNPHIPQEENLSFTAERLKKPLDYIKGLISGTWNSQDLSQLHKKLMITWNMYASKRLEKIIQEHPERYNILVSVGISHLPAYSEKYQDIGLR